VEEIEIVLRIKYDPAQIEDPSTWPWAAMFNTPDGVEVTIVKAEVPA
jgi:hypothetical protein